MRLGEYFVKQQIADEEQIEKALKIQAATGGKIGEILFAMTSLRSIDYYKVIAKHYQIEFVDLLKEQTDSSLLKSEHKEKYFSDMSIPIAIQADNYIVATADPSPETFHKIKQEYGDNTTIVCTSKFDILWTLQKCFDTDYIESAIYELSKKNAKLSAKYITPIWLRVIYCLPFFSMFILAIVNIKLALLIINCLILAGLSIIVIFKIILSVIGLFIIRKEHVDNADVIEKELPIYSVLVPLYKENQTTLNNLFLNLKKIIYPKHKLDIKILLEEDDLSTIAIVKKMRLPSYIEFIYVPAGEPRTKAKACNYGFKFVRGEYVCLYDAEDNPDPAQLIHVVQLFKNCENEKVACIQCKLNFYNSNENWLTKMFTIEYTYWFDLLLPALEFTNIPIPLGGTSNHFRTNILNEVVGWDPFNVTEDADLGLRLSRLGYTVKILNSTTYEEANCQLWNWIKQRTRWVKGYMQTYLVHMRNPFELWYKIGTRGFIGFQLFIGGTVLSNLSNIPMWLISITLLFLPQMDISYYFPGNVHAMALFNLYIGTVGIILLNVLGVVTRKKPGLFLSAFTSPFYWLLMSVASYRAFYQLIFNPSYWDKTQHGISNVFINNTKLSQEVVNMREITTLSGIKFGTSGLRAYNHLLTDKVCYEFATAFLQYLESVNKISMDNEVIIAGDYRDNTDHLVKIIIKAINDKGYSVINCGKIPTPALGYYCILRASAGMMVTGSHIPADMNGIKFYTRDGEIMKSDEQNILAQSFNIDNHLFDQSGSLHADHLYSAPITLDATEAYLNRYLQFYPEDALKGLKIGIYKHSSVAADILSILLNKLGAEIIIFGKSEQFYSLDTEALSAHDKQIVKQHLQSNGLDAVISTDGDADRPLLTDENGDWIPGDVIGMLCALILEAKYVVTPISSNSSVERINVFTEVIRTKIGSPYVIEKMEKLRHENKMDIIGYEANGGVLVGSNFVRDGKTLVALPTRDSAIAILSILSYINNKKIKISQLVSRYCCMYTESSSLKLLTSEKIQELFALLMQDNAVAENLQKFLKISQRIDHVDLSDGIRATLNDNSIIHFRASGNAPELRCYTESATAKNAKKLNRHGMNIISQWSTE